jgi:hypothetical protein
VTAPAEQLGVVTGGAARFASPRIGRVSLAKFAPWNRRGCSVVWQSAQNWREWQPSHVSALADACAPCVVRTFALCTATGFDAVSARAASAGTVARARIGCRRRRTPWAPPGPATGMRTRTSEAPEPTWHVLQEARA